MNVDYTLVLIIIFGNLCFHECLLHNSSSFCNAQVNHLVIPACLHFVYRLVAVVPGVQLFLSRMVVDAAVAGVPLWEEQHGTLIAACAWYKKRKIKLNRVGNGYS